MAAPSGTIWGSAVQGSKTGRQGKIGVYTNVTNTNTQTEVNIQVWFWTIFTCEDGTNNFYCNIGTDVTAATTKIGSKDISHPNNTTSWSTSNQTKLYDVTKTYTRGTSATTYKVYAKYNGIDMLPSKTMYVNTSFTVPALTKYTISYNTNGGSGAPSSQTKYYGKSLTLSSTKPTRTGYTFQGWATSASGSASYAAGSSYTGNANVTLYAVWKANTFTISYNANGGSGAPGNQTKTYGTALTLSSTKPTRTNYAFLGWATSASAITATYAAGGNFTTNANTTLYAVWELSYKKPTISNLSATRCNQSGTLADDGTYARLAFKWSTFQAVSSITVAWTDPSGEFTGSSTITASGTSGTVSQVIGSGAFNTETSYSFTVTVSDGSGSNYSTDRSTTMSGMEFHIDFGKDSVAIGKPAESLVDENGNVAKTLDVGWLSKFRNSACVGDKIGYQDGNQGVFLSWEGFMHLQRTTAQGYHPYIGFYLDDSKSASGLIRLNSSTKSMEFLSAAGYKFGNDIVLPNTVTISGEDPNGSVKTAFQPQNENGNTVVGHGNYSVKSGNTNIYGYDLNFGVSNIASPGTFRPYRRRGDSLSVSLRTAGYITGGGAHVFFFIPFSVPVIGSPTVTVSCLNGFQCRQGTKYLYGSSASAYAIPVTITASVATYNGIAVDATFDNTTNVTNNDTVGIYFNGTITFT